MSDYEGTLKQRGNSEGEIVMSRYMNRSNSMLVAVPINNNIQSPFTTYPEIVMLGKTSTRNLS